MGSNSESAYCHRLAVAWVCVLHLAACSAAGHLEGNGDLSADDAWSSDAGPQGDQQVSAHQDAAGGLDSRGDMTSTGCMAGFVDNGDGCVDVDECVEQPCDPLTTCTNLVGSFECGPCPAVGYRDINGDGTQCADIDECADGTARCDDEAACKNHPGTYVCNSCRAGFHRPAGNIKYFGFWKPMAWEGGDAPTSSYVSNLNMKYGVDDDDMDTVLDALANAIPGPRYILDASSLLHKSDPVRRKNLLRELREKIWARNLQYKIKIIAPWEEPYWTKCVTIDRVEYDVGITKEVFPEFDTMITFTANALTQYANGRSFTGSTRTIPNHELGIPDNLDYVGFDEGYRGFAGIEISQNAINAVKATASQPIIMTFQANESNLNQNNPVGDLLELVPQYWSLMKSEPRVVGALGWSWRGATGFEGTGYYYERSAAYKNLIDSMWREVRRCVPD